MDQSADIFFVMCLYNPWISLFIRRYFCKFLVTKIEMKKSYYSFADIYFHVMKLHADISLYGVASDAGGEALPKPWERLID